MHDCMRRAARGQRLAALPSTQRAPWVGPASDAQLDARLPRMTRACDVVRFGWHETCKCVCFAAYERRMSRPPSWCEPRTGGSPRPSTSRSLPPRPRRHRLVGRRIMEDEINARVGRRHAKLAEPAASRHGSAPGSVVSGGRPVRMQPPRSRTAPGDEVAPRHLTHPR
jgi:hypothetical protein